jgi:hypothetical protein
MTRPAVAVAFVIFFFANFSHAKTYVCDVKSTATFGTGTLRPIDNEDYWLGIIKKLAFDDDVGVLKYGGGKVWEEFKMRVWQKGTSSNDLIAIFMKEGRVRNPLNTLRIRAWEKGNPFVWDNGGDFFAGNCEVSGN